MFFYFISGILLSLGVSYVLYAFFRDKVLAEELKLDDAKGFYLIGCIAVAFALSALFFIAGQKFGYDGNEDTSTLMAISILLDIMMVILMLILGLVKIQEPEHY